MLEYTETQYTGEELKPAVTIEGLTEGVDYEVSYKDNVEAGTATVTVTGKGNYTGTQELTFVILEEDDVVQIWGKNRYMTAIGVAEQLKKEMGVDKFNTMIIATGNDFADALSGSYLAYVKNAPIILISESTASTVTSYVNANLAAGGKVYVLGGDAAVADSWLAGLNASYERLKGKSRFETNIAILEETGVTSGEILVCTGLVYADSLSASSAKKPIFLVSGDTLRDSQKAFLDKLSGATYSIIGGDAAVSEAMKGLIEDNYGDTRRIKGKNRYETSIAVANAYVSNPEAAVVAFGEKFPDGLCGGLLAIYADGPIILASDARSASVTSYIAANGIEKGYVLGGDGCFADSTIATMFSIKIEEIIKQRTPDKL